MAEILATISASSRNISPRSQNLVRFSPRSWRDLKISAAKNSPRSAAKISPRISARFQVRSRRPKTRRISARLQVRSRRDIQYLEGQKISPRKLEVISWQCRQDILKCQHSDPGKLSINSASEVVSSRQNEHTEIRLLTACQKQPDLLTDRTVTYSSEKLHISRHGHILSYLYSGYHSHAPLNDFFSI